MEPEEPDAGCFDLGHRRARGFRIDPVVGPAGDAERAVEAVRVEPRDDLTGEPLGTAGHADPAGTIRRWSAEYEEDGKPAQSREVLERGVKAYPADEGVARELGIARFRAKDCPGALQAVEGFSATSSDPDTINAVALFETCLGRRDEALALFERSLKIKPNQPGVLQSIELLRKAPPTGPGTQAP